MANTAHTDEETMRERYDSPAALEKKIDRLAALVRRANHMVAFTGAGISTSAGIPDFRGPEGKWTREAKGLQPLRGVSTVSALPTATHMSLVSLQKIGVLKYLISQNCDGLHRRSGFPAANISELHGNSNIEICEKCGQGYFRDIACHRLGRSRDHFTGRFCTRKKCNGALCEYTIDFGQNLPETPLKLATLHSRKADLHLAMGSSLTVSPACTMPELTADNDGALVIVNLQPTPLDDKATIKIHAKTDTVMNMLMNRLGHKIPPFLLQRRFMAGVANKKSSSANVFVKAVDIHDPSLEVSQIRRADPVTKSCVLRRVPVNLSFAGHYNEPPLQLNLDLEQSNLVDVQVAFDPAQRKWSLPKVVPLSTLPEVPAVAKARLEHGLEYTRAHRNYVIDGWCKGNPDCSREAMVAHSDKRCKHSRAAAAQKLASARKRGTFSCACSHIEVLFQINGTAQPHNTTNIPPATKATAAPADAKLPIRGKPGEFRKVATAVQRQGMQEHAKICNHRSCVTLWSGPWGPFIGGKDGHEYFDLTDCPVGSRLNHQIGWNVDAPRA